MPELKPIVDGIPRRYRDRYHTQCLLYCCSVVGPGMAARSVSQIGTSMDATDGQGYPLTQVLRSASW